jgi:D-alanine transaminase
MSRIAFVNGRYKRHSDAVVHIEDRGYQFSDGVYEVILVKNKNFIDEKKHFDRLDYSLTSLDISWPMKKNSMRQIMQELVYKNRFVTGIIYIQITRGVARRDHSFPKGIKPALVMTARRLPKSNDGDIKSGVSVITIKDIRWGRCDIKSVSLLPNVLGKQEARNQGAYEAWQIDNEGFVTEGTSTNAWIVSSHGVLITRGLSNQILSGITRLTLIKIATELNFKFEERQFSVDEAKSSREAFLTSSTSFLTPVTQIDGVVIGNGAVGLLSMRLLQAYHQYINSSEI